MNGRAILGSCLLALIVAGGCVKRVHIQQPNTTPAYEVDLQGDSFDLNGFPLNPHWVYQKNRNKLPTVETLCGFFAVRAVGDTAFLNHCTSQGRSIEFVYAPPSTDWFACTSGGAPSHINWRVGHNAPLANAAVVHGRVYLFRSAQPDGDLDFLMRTRGDPGRTARDPVVNSDRVSRDSLGRSLLELEFRRRELEDVVTSGWWGKLLGMLRPGPGEGLDYSQAIRTVDGLEAVAMGIFGVDYVHEAHSEIHPVLAMAIRTDTHGQRDETWSVFVRNWGNEGPCAKDVQRLNLPDRTFQMWLPWHPGAVAAHVSFDGNASVRRMVFTHPPISIPIRLPGVQRPIVTGDFTIHWDGNLAAVPLRAQPIQWSKHPDTPEEAMEHAWEALSDIQRGQIEDRVRAYDESNPEPHTVRLSGGVFKRIHFSGEGRDSVRLAEWCRVTAGEIPGVGRCPRRFYTQ